MHQRLWPLSDDAPWTTACPKIAQAALRKLLGKSGTSVSALLTLPTIASPIAAASRYPLQAFFVQLPLEHVPSCHPIP